MAKKEVKNPRKPATKKVSKAKKEATNQEVVVVPEIQDECEVLVGKEENNNFAQFNEFKAGENEFDLTKADNETALEFYKKMGSEDLVVVKDDKKDDENVKKEETSTINPQEVINEFTEAAKNLDNLVISENPEEALKAELAKVDEVTEKLQEQIKKQEEELHRSRNTTYNGVSDGWFDY
jgi:hypothetical protein